ncbi:peptidylprolyl isomerase [Adlercreutzia sp. ZJ304]|uniref:peptidylprolyl isomerase n=1 Tax=Adlercreutzia sp. ZJ304 TaxID=2709791 RepID=UPI0013EABF81|nr:peptidylprolyl isomerase [Adlercreutzia sp. ZJ304]
MKKIFRYGAALAISAVCVLGIAGCAETTSEKGLTPDTGLTGGVAATVNGAEIPEDDITRNINSLRLNASAEDDDAWAKYLNQMGYTPSSLREYFLDSMIDQQLVIQFADDEGCGATDEEIQGQVDKMRQNYSSDEAWQEALENSGFETEDDYREALKYSIGNEKLKEKFANEAVADDAKVLEQAQSQYNGKGTMRRSSHILFAESDQAKAQEVLGQLQAGTLDFAEAAKEYSTDTGSAENGGDVGWDGTNSFVEAYQTALDGLQVGEMTDLVQSDYGWHIIKCTDMVTVPDEITDLSQVPDSLLVDIRASVKETQASEDLSAWKKSKRESSDVVINDMPENVPYNVDMSAYETPEEEKATDEAAEENLVEDVENTENAVDSAEAATNEAGNDAGAADASGAAPEQPAEGESSAATEGGAQ